MNFDSWARSLLTGRRRRRAVSNGNQWAAEFVAGQTLARPANWRRVDLCAPADSTRPPDSAQTRPGAHRRAGPAGCVLGLLVAARRRHRRPSPVVVVVVFLFVFVPLRRRRRRSARGSKCMNRRLARCLSARANMCRAQCLRAARRASSSPPPPSGLHCARAPPSPSQRASERAAKSNGPPWLANVELHNPRKLARAANERVA